MGDDVLQWIQLSGEHVADKVDYYVGDEYFEKIRSMGKNHNGFPETMNSYSFGIGQLKFKSATSGSKREEILGTQADFLREFQTTFNLKRNALFTVYPKNGFISWHNNANASAYNFIFTYSETGDGYWRHWDNVKKEFVVIPDVQGWQCKAGYFGAYVDGEDKLVYHSAKNGDTGKRMTIAFVLDRSEMSSGLQEWIIEDIHE
jgi:hypothetical protein